MYLIQNKEQEEETYQELFEAIELESQKIEKQLLNDIAGQDEDSIYIFFEYMKHAQNEGIEDDIYECLLSVLAEAASSEDEHDPMVRVIRAAVKFEANKIALQNVGVN